MKTDATMTLVVALREFQRELTTICNNIDNVIAALPGDGCYAPPGERTRAMMQKIAAAHGISVEIMLSQQRTADVLAARDELIYELHHGRKMSYSEIGRRLKRDHTTIRTAVAREKDRRARAMLDESAVNGWA